MGSAHGERNIDREFVEAFPIISGRGKTAKLLSNMRPYGFYFMTAMETLCRIPRLLVIGTVAETSMSRP
jgi:hypothetical protein